MARNKDDTCLLHLGSMLKRKKKKGYFFIGKLYLHPADLE
jgi:hypothetical protein